MIGSLLGIAPVSVTIILLSQPWIRSANVMDIPLIGSLPRELPRVEAAGRGDWLRVEAVVRFAERLGAKHLGIATCVGLIEESRILHDILAANGFDNWLCQVKCVNSESVE